MSQACYSVAISNLETILHYQEHKIFYKQFSKGQWANALRLPCFASHYKYPPFPCLWNSGSRYKCNLLGDINQGRSNLFGYTPVYRISPLANKKRLWRDFPPEAGSRLHQQKSRKRRENSRCPANGGVSWLNYFIKIAKIMRRLIDDFPTVLMSTDTVQELILI